jgi:hypothetical protein
MWSFFGSSRFVHLAPAAVAVFLFRSPNQLAKAQCKDYVSAGIVVDADAAVLCLHDFCHDGKP